MRPTLPGTLAALGAAALLAACGSPPPPETMTRSFKIVDENGNTAGTVTFDPLGGGMVMDHTGRPIGRIVRP